MENAEPSRAPYRLNSAEPARGSRLFLFLSVGLNLGLLLLLAWAGLRSTPQAVPLSDHRTQVRGRILKPQAKRVAVPSPWQQLESNDLAVYAANLRAAGCPPKTVRDILLPWLDEKFDYAKSPVPEPTNFWASFSQRQTAAVARADQEMTLRQEKDKTLKEMLGFTWASEGLRQAYAGEAAGPVGFLDYDRAEKFLCVADRFEQQFARADCARRIDCRSTVYQVWCQEAGEVLSPAEFEETELRGILMIYQRRNPNVYLAGLSGSELRQLMVFRHELCHPLPSALLAGGDDLLQELDWAGEQQFQTKTRSLLGDSRFIDYLKNCDASIERILAMLETEHLPQSRALQLFDLRQESLAQAQKIRQLPLRRAEKRTQLAALRQNAIDQLTALSNATTDSPLFRINQDWLQEIATP